MRSRYILYMMLTVLMSVVSSCGSSRKAAVSQPTRAGENVGGRPVRPVMPMPDDSNHPSAVLLEEARKWLGTRYLYGGHSKDGTDCSGMVMEVFNASAGIKLPRSSREQHKYCRSVAVGDLMPGDLVFFANNLRTGRIGHVGLYVGEGLMIHASTSRGVIVSGLDEDYWKKHYAASGRVEDFEKIVDKYQKSRGKRKNNKKSESKSDKPVRGKRRGDSPRNSEPSSSNAAQSVAPSESPQWFD